MYAYYFTKFFNASLSHNSSSPIKTIKKINSFVLKKVFWLKHEHILQNIAFLLS